MNILELFAGSRSIGKIAETLKMDVFSIDIEPLDKINLIKDIEFLKPEDIPFIPDIIWASPPCTTYSIAGISHHRDGTIPRSELAIKSDKLLTNTVSLIWHFLSINGGMKYFIENPVGMMRKMPIMLEFDRATVSYCRYGDSRMKPTDIWTNNLAGIFNPNGWRPIAKCFNNNVHCHHESAPRGSRTGTQGLKGDYERSKIPPLLCKEILMSCVLK